MLVRSLKFCARGTAYGFRNTNRSVGVMMPSALPSSTVRTFSIIGDAFTKMATNKMESDKDKRFASMLETMLSGEKWSLRPWKKTLEDQLGSWLMYVPGMKDSSETKELNAYKDMLNSFLEQELDDPTIVDTKAKERIARETGKSVDEVSKLLTFYKQSLIVQQWLVMKKSNGERLPTTEPELRIMQENDVRLRAIGSKILQGNGPARKKGRGRGSPF